mmetsp:Transcript_34718/g.97416  ORF Transcript_34718/g.97416 Transcript_34718/m.97416 type:complete len:269 (-) Transcript_34718:77-883(-)
MLEEAVGLQEQDHTPRCTRSHLAAVHGPHSGRAAPAALEASVVTGADEKVRGRLHARHVQQRSFVMLAAAQPVHVALPAGDHDIEVRFGDLHVMDVKVTGQTCVQLRHQVLDGQVAQYGVELNHLGQRVHAGVRAAGGDGADPLPEQLAAGVLQDLLEGPQARLPHPAVEVGPVERHGQPHPPAQRAAPVDDGQAIGDGRLAAARPPPLQIRGLRCRKAALSQGSTPEIAHRGLGNDVCCRGSPITSDVVTSIVGEDVKQRIRLSVVR